VKIHRVNPPELGEPLGQYSHVTLAPASGLVFVAGQLSHGIDIDAQCEGVFTKIGQALQATGSGWLGVAQFTTYLTSERLIEPFMQWRLKRFPSLFGDSGFPPNTLLIVSRLVDPKFLIEVQTIAFR